MKAGAAKAMTKGTLWLKLCPQPCFIIRRFISPHHTMLPPMKSMKAGAAKAMTKGALLKAIATEHGLKTKACSNVLNSLVTVAAKEVKKTGVFAVLGLCRIKTRTKPATKACTKMIFGKETKVKAKPAKTVVKAFPAAALKQQI